MDLPLGSSLQAAPPGPGWKLSSSVMCVLVLLNMGQKPLAVSLLTSGLQTSYRSSFSCPQPASHSSYLCFSLYQLCPAHPTASTRYAPSCALTPAIPGSLACPAGTDVWRAVSATLASSSVVFSASPGPSVGASTPQPATSW